MMVVQLTAKLVLAAMLASGLSLSNLPTTIQAETSDEDRIDTATEAIGQANSLNLIPAGARAAASRKDGKWEITFKGDRTDEYGNNPLLAGFVTLYADDGNVALYSVSVRSDYIIPTDMDPFDESKLTFSVDEAQAIAFDFIKQQDWKLADSWMYDPYPISEYEYSRFHTPTMHVVRFDRSHNGIRDGSNGVEVTVDRLTGEIRGYSVYWDDHAFDPDSVDDAAPDMIDMEEAAKIFYDTVDPFLKWQAIKDPDQPKLVYALHHRYVMAADGTFPSDYQWVNPAIPEKIKPAYSSELAKRRLLSMYDLGLEYINGKLAYRITLKPEITFFQEGWQPAIDAHTGEWLNFLNEPITKPFPPADEWLIHAAPIGMIDYAAAMVWDNELLQMKNEPIIQNGFTLVPFRELLSKLGARITWDPETRKVTASKGSTTIELTIDSYSAYINGNEKKLEAPAIIKDGHTYIPARFVLETFGMKVGWNNESRLVLIYTEDNMPDPSPDELKQYRFQAQLNWENKMNK